MGVKETFLLNFDHDLIKQQAVLEGQSGLEQMDRIKYRCLSRFDCITPLTGGCVKTFIAMGACES